MTLESIIYCYDIIVCCLFLFSFCSKIPVAVSHYSSNESNAAFHIYVSAVFMTILGLIINLFTRYYEQCANSFKLPLLSCFLLFLGSVVFCINGIYWSNDECNYKFSHDTIQYNCCWSSNFLQFLSVSLMILYLITLILREIFETSQRLFILNLTNISIVTYLIVYLFLNQTNITMFFGAWNYLSISFIFSTWFVLFRFDGKSEYTATHIFYAWSIIAIIVSILGTLSFWYYNPGDCIYNISFIGHSLMISSVNVWIIIEAIQSTQPRTNYLSLID